MLLNLKVRLWNKRTFAAWAAEMVCACNFAVKVVNKGEPEDVFELALYCVIAGIQVYRWEGVPQERKPTEIEVFVSGSFYNRLNEFPVAA